MASVPESKEIGVFPNSGHHYEFVPIPHETLERNKALEQLCKEDQAPWRSHPEHSWILYRPSTRFDGTRGFLVAIESNLGGRERGLVYEPRQSVEDRSVPLEYDPLKTPYAFRDLGELGGIKPLTLSIPIYNEHGAVTDEVKLKPIVWKRPSAEEPVTVDLVIDFGNTRTVALLLENDREPRPFREVCRPVRFMPRGTGFDPFISTSTSDDPLAIVDSWIVMHETVFSDIWPPHAQFNPMIHYEIVDKQTKRFFARPEVRRVIRAETRYAPQMFVELSPVLLGGGNGKDSARQTLNDARLERDGNFFLSSPKRYAWDSNPVGFGGSQYWHVELNRWNPLKREELVGDLPELKGPVLLFMDSDGRNWEIDRPPNERANFEQRPHADERPIHPRRDTLTWVALNIIETAYRQLSSQNYRNVAGRPFVPRRLRSVLVTFPSGWTAEELSNYRAQWQKAINIFTLSHLKDRRLVADGGDRPQLITDLDEAVASQLPIIYSEMTRLRGRDNWIELFGRGQGANAKLRVMNIDIGGGTTDVSVVDYRDTIVGPQVALEATVVFKNSSTVAGDMLVKSIIENVLLPKMGAVWNQHERRNEMRLKFERLFRNTPDEWQASEPAYRQKLGRIVRLVFIPIVNFWLSELAKHAQGRATAWDNKPIEDICDANEGQLVQKDQLAFFTSIIRRFLEDESLDLLPPNQPFPPDLAQLRECIEGVFTHLFKVLGRVASAFDCDIVLVSGKPSELPDIQELLLKFMPLLPNRVIFSKGFPVGHWYPMGALDGRIHDAKTPTVVGAALAQAMRGAKIRDWRLTSQRKFILNENYWGVMAQGDTDSQFDRNVFLKPGETIYVGDMLVDTRIGRKRYLSRYLSPDQIYLLDWKRGQHRHEKPLLKVTLERVTADDSTERLLLKHVDGVDERGHRISTEHVELKLCTLSDGEFWMDNPQFEVGWRDS
jgi:hypothetical protein